MLYCFKSLVGVNNVFIKQAGLDAVTELRDLRSNPSHRALRLRDDVFNWLYSEELIGGHVSGVSDFLDSSTNHYLRKPYSQEELYRATKWLLDEAPAASNNPGPVNAIRSFIECMDSTSGSRMPWGDCPAARRHAGAAHKALASLCADALHDPLTLAQTWVS